MFQTIQSRFSLYYFFVTGYFAVPLVILPLLCHARGFTPEQIALVGVGSTLCSIVGGPAFLHLADKTTRITQLLSASLFACALSFAVLYFIDSFYIFLAVWIVHHFFFKAQAIVDARAIRLSAEKEITFEIVRTWGSVGFVVISYLIGLSLSAIGSAASVFTTTFFLLISWQTFKYIRPHMLANNTAAEKETQSTPDTAKSKVGFLSFTVLALLLLNILNWSSHAPLYLYLSIYLEELGWSGTGISIAWTVGVIAEITLFLSIPRICSQPKHYANLMIVAAIFTCIRWYAMSTGPGVVLIVLCQALHAFSFGAVYIGSMKLVFHLLPENYRDKGQGYIQAAGMGVGTLIGNAYFGYRASLLPSYLDTPALFAVSFLIALGCIPLSMVIRASVKEANHQ